MIKNIGFAIGVGAAALVLLAGGRRASATPTTPPRSGLPPMPPPGAPPDPGYSYPDVRPRPRATPKAFKFESLHRYEIVADVLPIQGVSTSDFAEKALEYFGMAKPTFSSAKDATRDGWDVKRVKFSANVVTGRSVSLESFYSIAGAGTIWLVSAKDITKF
jgi:hypothetical protein